MQRLLSTLAKNKYDTTGRPLKPKKLKLTIKEDAFDETELSLLDQFTLVDAVMLLPLNGKQQLQIYVYKINDKEFVDMRLFQLGVNHKFNPTKNGFRFPIELLRQVLIRLDRLYKNIGKRKSKNKFNLELE